MSLLVRAQSAVSRTFRRNIGITAIVGQKATDPIQQLFVQAIREYEQKSKAAGGKLVDSNPETEKQLKNELERITRIYGGEANVDMTKFPQFKFEDPTPTF